MLRSLSLLPYNVGSSYILYLIHIFIMVCTCRSGMSPNIDLIFMVYRFYQIYINFSSLSHFLHHLQLRFTMFGPHIYHGGYLSGYLWPHFHSLLVLLNMITCRSVSPLYVPYHLGSPRLVHTSWCVHVSQAFVTWHHGVYMSVGHLSPDLGLIFMVCWLC